MRAVFRRPNLDDTEAIRGTAFCPGSMLRTIGKSRTCSSGKKVGKYFGLMRRRSLPPGFCCWRVSKPGCFDWRSRLTSRCVNASGRSSSPFLRVQISPSGNSYVRARRAINGSLSSCHPPFFKT